jgi:isopentenyl diphosphate isomerase/L-lactate dehydrogenase-like FMN-dependent dehydrogenase
MDVFKALALGADAVCVGRALMGPLKEGGADAAKVAIEAMGRELSRAMAMTGSPDIRHIDPQVIVRL